MKIKYMISLLLGGICLLISIYYAILWADSIYAYLNNLYIWWVIIGIALLPGFLMSTMFFSNLFHYKLKKYKSTNEPTTVILCAYNEERCIERSIKSICEQNYKGRVQIIVVDNHSTDLTKFHIYNSKKHHRYNCDINYVYCSEKGKSKALNYGLRFVKTKYFITVDADTFLEKNAIQNIMDHIITEKSSCVAGNLFVYNCFDSIFTRMQIYDYLLSIAAVKRFQGSYNSTLVAQGAFSAYYTKHVLEAGGWKEVLGEDILLTYDLLRNGYRSTYEPKAVAYTTVPAKFGEFYNQRKRWATGMLEGLKHVKPWQQKSFYTKFFTSINLLIIYLDLAYVFGFLVGVILAFLGYYYFVGLLTIYTLIISVINFTFMYVYQRKLGIPFQNSILGLSMFLLFFQTLQTAASLNGYFDMVLKREVNW